jgi:hypothetical protein
MILFDVICNELYLQVDTMAWRLAEVFGSWEYVSLATRALTHILT